MKKDQKKWVFPNFIPCIISPYECLYKYMLKTCNNTNFVAGYFNCKISGSYMMGVVYFCVVLDEQFHELAFRFHL